MERTDYEKLLIDVVKILDDLKIDYFVTGGFAVSVWGKHTVSSQSLAIGANRWQKRGYNRCIGLIG